MALLLPLAERLGVSATELLAGVPIQEAAAKTLEIPPRDTAGDLLSYTQGAAAQRQKRLRLWLFAGLSGSFLLSAAVCWICDMALNRELTWSLIVCVSLALAWAVLLPLLTARRLLPGGLRSAPAEKDARDERKNGPHGCAGRWFCLRREPGYFSWSNVREKLSMKTSRKYPTSGRP